MLDDLGIGEDGAGDGDTEIPISNEEVNGEVFKKALMWMEKNRGKLMEANVKKIVKLFIL